MKENRIRIGLRAGIKAIRIEIRTGWTHKKESNLGIKMLMFSVKEEKDDGKNNGGKKLQYKRGSIDG